ncbi:MAG: hypothetical protein WB439_14050 [Acidobacteriaceae bacterium]
MRLYTPSPLPKLITRCALVAVVLAAITGCHAHYVSMDVHNASSEPVSLVEVDYPSASFGMDTLAAGANYHYRFKIIGDGPTKLLWTDVDRHNHTATGPSLHEGQEGTLTVTINDSNAGANAAWQSNLRSN